MSQSQSQPKGKLNIVGTGPGSLSMLTESARSALRSSEFVIGNKLYLDLITEIVSDKKVILSHMGQEIARAKKAVELARSATVSIVSGGDPGVYGMASIILEIAEKEAEPVEIEVFPGISAANASAAKLGSPLSGDFVVLSLSDLLTPWKVIEARLNGAFSMRVPVVIYNPKSHSRRANFNKAMLIALAHLKSETPVGIVKNAYRGGESVKITTLGELAKDDSFVDMHSTVIVGGEESRLWLEGENVKGIITPRGYHNKYVY